MNAARQNSDDYAVVDGLDQTRCGHCGAAAGRHLCRVLGRETGHLPEEQPSCTSCGDVAEGCPSCDGRQHRAVALAGKPAPNGRLRRSRGRGGRR
jgi:hypothetical protein